VPRPWFPRSLLSAASAGSPVPEDVAASALVRSLFQEVHALAQSDKLPNAGVRRALLISPRDAIPTPIQLATFAVFDEELLNIGRKSSTNPRGTSGVTVPWCKRCALVVDAVTLCRIIDR